MEVKKDIKNDLMQRRELELVLDFDKNPSFADATRLIAQDFKANEDQIMVENVLGKFGRKTFLIKAAIYNTKELKDESVKRLIKPKKDAAVAA
jgi:ribosomal protein S24E